MAEDYDVESDLGYTRFLISDVTAGDGQVFTDAEILAVLGRSPSVEIAAALLCDRIADNEALIGKVIRTQDLQTNGPQVSAVMRASAAQFRADHAANMEAAGGQVTIIDFAPYGYGFPELTEHA